MNFGAKPETGAARACGTEEAGVEEMLTVKHIDQTGCERIYSANEVKYVPDVGDAESFGHAGVYLDPEEDPAGQYQGASCVIPVSRTRSGEDRASPTVWVMNRFGATVATYHL